LPRYSCYLMLVIPGIVLGALGGIFATLSPRSRNNDEAGMLRCHDHESSVERIAVISEVRRIRLAISRSGPGFRGVA
jgi:hypothetical protein